MLLVTVNFPMLRMAPASRHTEFRKKVLESALKVPPELFARKKLPGWCEDKF